MDTKETLRAIPENIKQSVWKLYEDPTFVNKIKAVRIVFDHQGKEGLERAKNIVEHLCPDMSR